MAIEDGCDHKKNGHKKCQKKPEEPFCDKERGNCRSCINDLECKEKSPSKPKCNKIFEKCVACLNQKDCESGKFCKNDGTCGKGCKDNKNCKHPEKSLCVGKEEKGSCKLCNNIDPKQCEHIEKYPFCVQGQGCKECTKDNLILCTDPNRHCSEDTYTCQICGTHEHCRQLNTEKPYCVVDQATNAEACVACRDSGDCKNLALPYCNKGNEDPTCSASCKSLPSPFKCDERELICHSTGECRECETKEHCKHKIVNDAFACNSKTSRCVECTTDKDCNENGDWRTCNINTHTCESRQFLVKCRGFHYKGGNAPELKIHNEQDDMKIAFHFPSVEAPNTPTTVNCPYKEHKQKEWINFGHLEQMGYRKIVAMCREEFKKLNKVWKWSSTAVIANTVFPHDGNAETELVLSSVPIPDCFTWVYPG